jgi:hypothetical protein
MKFVQQYIERAAAGDLASLRRAGGHFPAEPRGGLRAWRVLWGIKGAWRRHIGFIGQGGKIVTGSFTEVRYYFAVLHARGS